MTVKVLGEMFGPFHKVPTFEEIAEIKPESEGPLPDRRATNLLNSPAVLQFAEIARHLDAQDEHRQKREAFHHALRGISHDTGVPHQELHRVATSPQMFDMAADDDAATADEGFSEAESRVARPSGLPEALPLTAGDELLYGPRHQPRYLEIGGQRLELPSESRAAADEANQIMLRNAEIQAQARREEMDAQMAGLAMVAQQQQQRAEMAENMAAFLQDQIPRHHVTLNQYHAHHQQQVNVAVQQFGPHNRQALAQYAAEHQIPIEDLIEFFEAGGQHHGHPQGAGQLQLPPVPDDDDDLAEELPLHGNLRPMNARLNINPDQERAFLRLDGRPREFLMRQSIASLMAYTRSRFGQEWAGRPPKAQLVEFIMQRRG